MERIAIFDDDEDLVQILEDILTDEGYEVITFHTPPTVEMVADLSTDACLVDVWFGDEPKGVEFVQELKKKKNESNFRLSCDIYVMSSDPDSRSLAHSPYIRRFFQKPLDFSQIVSLLSQSKSF